MQDKRFAAAASSHHSYVLPGGRVFVRQAAHSDLPPLLHRPRAAVGHAGVEHSHQRVLVWRREHRQHLLDRRQGAPGVLPGVDVGRHHGRRREEPHPARQVERADEVFGDRGEDRFEGVGAQRAHCRAEDASEVGEEAGRAFDDIEVVAWLKRRNAGNLDAECYVFRAGQQPLKRGVAGGQAAPLNGPVKAGPSRDEAAGPHRLKQVLVSEELTHTLHLLPAARQLRG
ncbi:MAG: hypothetical protein J3K34DRAFT_403549 [Monoraphidium minutum]|nr:MAG: hypothetical protein J3K34DRAFT_403549 [Monoraphidium minutum]